MGVEACLAQKPKDHEHVSEIAMELYIGVLKGCQINHRTIEDIWFPPTRWFANRIFQKRSTCSECYRRFQAVMNDDETYETI